jgi:hypothetical protein
MIHHTLPMVFFSKHTKSFGKTQCPPMAAAGKSHVIFSCDCPAPESGRGDGRHANRFSVALDAIGLVIVLMC